MINTYAYANINTSLQNPKCGFRLPVNLGSLIYEPSLSNYTLYFTTDDFYPNLVYIRVEAEDHTDMSRINNNDNVYERDELLHLDTLEDIIEQDFVEIIKDIENEEDN